MDQTTLVAPDPLEHMNAYRTFKPRIREARIRENSEPTERLSNHNDNHQKHMALRAEAHSLLPKDSVTHRSQLKLEHDNSPHKVRDRVCKKRPESNVKGSGGGKKARVFIPWCR